ncbi:hypothetical protein [Halostella salina]|uniref:hypothetical protein n=1 Tax=Halostella salina TaxID=1547897 RepID=UPI000EF77127|nr:hypothetical protein [Halostella salina]
MGNEVEFPVGKAILSMLFGASLFPITYPISYFLGYLDILSWNSVVTWGFLGPMFFVGIPVVLLDFPEKLAERLTVYWMIVAGIGWATLIITMQFFNSDVPESRMNVYAMGATLIVVTSAISLAAYLDYTDAPVDEYLDNLRTS